MMRTTTGTKTNHLKINHTAPNIHLMRQNIALSFCPKTSSFLAY